jgi:hypothetical protein
MLKSIFGTAGLLAVLCADHATDVGHKSEMAR